MKKITVESSIFSLDKFIKDKYVFSIIYLNLDDPELLMISDEENYLVCRGHKGLPTWVWTVDGISDEKLKEASLVLREYIDEDDLRFTSKKNFYDYLKKNNYKYLDDYYFEMGVLTLEELKIPKKCDGVFRKVNLSDLKELANNWYEATNEMVDTKGVSFEQAKSEVLEMYDTNNFYCWENKNGKIVCMLEYEVYYGQAKLTHVYTPIKDRNKGYAANIVYEITKKLIKSGIVPVLYTNYNYLPSNKSYGNVGFVDAGVLINFRCSNR